MTESMTDEEWAKRIEALKSQGIEFAEKVTSPIQYQNTKNTFEFKYGFLLKREDKYWLRYGGSGHGGPDIIHEITEEEYVGGRSGTINLMELLDKYPEKDGDAHKGAIIKKRWLDKGIFYEK